MNLRAHFPAKAPSPTRRVLRFIGAEYSQGTQNSLARRWVAWERGFGELRLLLTPVFLAAGSRAVVLELASEGRQRQALVMHNGWPRFEMLR